MKITILSVETGKPEKVRSRRVGPQGACCALS